MILIFFSANYGKEFYVGIIPIHPIDVPNVPQIDIATRTAGDLILEQPYLNIHNIAHLPERESSLELPRDLVKHGSFIGPMGIYINSSVDISVYVSNMFAFYGDTYTALPLEALGKKYVIATYESKYYSTTFMVIATENATTITVTLVNGTSFQKHLNRLDAFQYAVEFEDLSGVTVEADKPVAVVSGNECLFFELSNNCEKTMVQLLPTNFWDTRFIVPRLDANDSLYDLEDPFVRVFSLEKSGTLFCINHKNDSVCDNTLNGTINFVEEKTENETVTVWANGSLQLIEFAENEGAADPFMSLIPGVSQYLSDYSFVIPTLYDELRNYLAIIAVFDDLDSIVVDNDTLGDPEKLYDVPEPFDDYVVGIYNSSTGYHRAYNIKQRGFGIICFGTEKWINYGFLAGIFLSNG